MKCAGSRINGRKSKSRHGPSGASSAHRLTMRVTSSVQHYDHVTVTANADGNLDKRTLLDLLMLAFYSWPPSDKMFR
jgi:hypothetical protein